MIGARRLALVRRLLSRAAQARAAAAATPVVQVDVPPQRKVPATDQQLQLKYKSDFEKQNFKTVHEIVDVLEWRTDSVQAGLLYVVVEFARRCNDLNSLSDRQLAVVISAFSSRCSALSKHKRKQLLDEMLGILKNSGVQLMHHARNALLSARIDNGEELSVVTELQSLETAGFSPDVNTLTSLSRIYARQGNAQGVIDLIQYMKTAGMSPDEAIIKQLVFALARGGNYDKAISTAKNFFGSMNEVGLRCCIASAAASKGDCSKAVDILAQIPASAKPTAMENNKLLLDVLFELVDAKVSGAVEKVLPYLNTTADGSTLSEFHNNLAVANRARQGLSDNELEFSLDLYSIVHPSYKKDYIDKKFLEVLSSRLRDSALDLNYFDRLVSRCEKMGLLSDGQLFTLEASPSSPHIASIVRRLINSDKLLDYIAKEPDLRKRLAKGLGQQLASSRLTEDEKSAVLSDIAFVLFAPKSESFYADASIIYQLGGKDVNLVISALKSVRTPGVRKLYATAVIQQILQSDEDPLKFEKLEKLLDSKSVDALSCGLIRSQLLELILNRKKNEAITEAEKQTLVARLIALDFPSEDGSYQPGYQGSQVLEAIIVNKSLTAEKAVELVAAFKKEPRIRLSFVDIERMKKSLIDSNQNEKAQLPFILKGTNMMLKKWFECSVGELEHEMAEMASTGSQKTNRIRLIRDVIMKKLADQKPCDYEACIRYLNEAKDLENESLEFSSRRLFRKSLQAALQENRIDIAKKLWEAKPGFDAEAALAYISVNFLNERISDADATCEELRASAHTTTQKSLNMTAKVIEGVDVEKVCLLCDYLSSKLSVRKELTTSLITTIKNRQLKELIAEKQLSQALSLACKYTAASGRAFGQDLLFEASFENNDPDLTRSVYQMVMNAHDKNTAVLDFAFACLMRGLNSQATKLLKTNGLYITSQKLSYFTGKAIHTEKPEVLRTLFSALSDTQAASTVDLNKLLLELSKLYYRKNNRDALLELEKECNEKSFPLEHQIREMFKGLHTE